ncbi:MAG: ATP-binding protein [Bacteroidota bacterium]
MKTKRIVITGGPSVGKTSLIESLKSLDYICFPEVIREFTIEETENKAAENLTSNPIVFADDSLLFNKRLMAGRSKQYQESKLLDTNYIFFDRGLPDVLAYMDFFDQSYDTSFTEACEAMTYDMVFILPPWETIFALDGERYESYEELVQLNECLVERYTHFGNVPIEVPKATIAERVQFILNKLAEAFE